MSNFYAAGILSAAKFESKLKLRYNIYVRLREKTKEPAVVMAPWLLPQTKNSKSFKS
jgi:hypothetical protein